MAEWWKTDNYGMETGVPPAFLNHSGPNQVALVRVWPDGRTDPGWGNEFMERYNRSEFNARRVLYGYEKGRWAFAFIMRSVQMVCIDIDGKNGGLEHAKRLGLLPPTLTETSKSGDGYHLYYRTAEAWDENAGFALINDRIGLEQGVDLRGVGCVYHHATQRWNSRPIVPLPSHLQELLLARDQRVAAVTARINKVLTADDELEVLMLHDELGLDLAKPIPAGKRNTTLFAIGSQMKMAGVEKWADKIERRGLEVGLDGGEISKIIANVERYTVVV